MVLDSKLHAITEHFGVLDPEDWAFVRPESILAIPDIGPQTLNHLRLMLANRGITLADDQTPAYWQSHLGLKRGASQIAGNDSSVLSPFTVYVDTREQNPFRFLGFRADADKGGVPMMVRTESRSLGNSCGDYSATGLIDYAHIERKSREDAWGTVLGWGERREQFQKTLKFLSEIPNGLIVLECSEDDALRNIPSWGKRSQAGNRKIFFRQTTKWLAEYGVPWAYCDNRSKAEHKTYRYLECVWRMKRQAEKRAAIEAAKNEMEL
jgi:hypothetical protein